MRILALHNRYLVSGGEDQSHAIEISLLREQGHTVDEYLVDNAVIAGQSMLTVAANTIWSWDSYAKVKKLLRENHYDLMVVQNFFPLLSPSVHYAAKSEGVPVIQFLRNYRQFCLNGLALRKNKPCEACLERLPLPGVYYACYRESRLASLAVALMVVTHRILRTWRRKVDTFVALTEFAKGMNVRAGLPVDRIFVKPNFVHPDPGLGQGDGNYALYVGRLSEEKGIQTLVDAWEMLGGTVQLKIVGDGPLQKMVENATYSNASIDYLGRQQQSEIVRLMKNAAILVFPSLCYENMPRTIIEAFAVGTPVVAGKIGAASEMIESGGTGYFFRVGDAADLAERVRFLISEPELRNKMRIQARSEYESKYTLEKNVAYWAQLQDLFSRKSYSGDLWS
jgi:glycosyltransferase involved in cell wall biosynthesis